MQAAADGHGDGLAAPGDNVVDDGLCGVKGDVEPMVTQPKPGAVVVDVGINRIPKEDGPGSEGKTRLVGDAA